MLPALSLRGLGVCGLGVCGLGLCALLLAGCSSDAQETSTSTDATRAANGSCANLIVIGALGSTQNPDLNSGVGTEVRLTTDRLIRLVHARSAKTVGLEAIDYDSAAAASLDAYLAHTAEGATMMTSRLREIARACPDSRFALLGFSQGAQVVHGAAAHMPSELARRVALVAMIADPSRDPADRIRHWSYADSPAPQPGKVGAGAPIDPALRDVAISLCVAADDICNDVGAPGGPPSAAHKHFYEKPSTVRITAKQLDSILQAQGI